MPISIFCKDTFFYKGLVLTRTTLFFISLFVLLETFSYICIEVLKYFSFFIYKVRG